MANKKETVKAAVYTKEQLLKSRKYENRRDLLEALLASDQTYTIAETDKKIQTFMKGKVN